MTKDNYLPALVQARDFDVRKTAAKNPRMTAEEYLKYIADFLDKLPLALSVLTALNSDKHCNKDVSCLFGLKEALEEAGCYTYSQGLADISCGRVQPDALKELITDLTAFGKRILKGQKISKTLYIDDEEYEATYAGKLKESLPAFLEWLNTEEEKRAPRVMVVDDAAFTLRSVSYILGKEYKVFTVAKPEMVEKFLEQVVPDLFLLDYKMPNMNGFDLVPIIRSFEEHKNTPIIFLTSKGTTEHISAAMKLGACDFIVKPFDSDALRQKIAKNMQRKRLF